MANDDNSSLIDQIEGRVKALGSGKAPDALSQLGILIRQIRNDAKHALERATQNFPYVERVRDIFSTDDPFIMDFYIEKGIRGVNVSLDLNFDELPPAIATSPCKQFDASSTTFDLGHSYNAGELEVYQNDVLLTLTTDYLESDPAGGIVVLTGAVIVDEADQFFICSVSVNTSEASNLKVRDGTTTVTQVNDVLFSGATVSGSTGTATVTVTGGGGGGGSGSVARAYNSTPISVTAGFGQQVLFAGLTVETDPENIIDIANNQLVIPTTDTYIVVANIEATDNIGDTSLEFFVTTTHAGLDEATMFTAINTQPARFELVVGPRPFTAGDTLAFAFNSINADVGTIKIITLNILHVTNISGSMPQLLAVLDWDSGAFNRLTDNMAWPITVPSDGYLICDAFWQPDFTVIDGFGPEEEVSALFELRTTDLMTNVGVRKDGLLIVARGTDFNGSRILSRQMLFGADGYFGLGFTPIVAGSYTLLFETGQIVSSGGRDYMRVAEFQGWVWFVPATTNIVQNIAIV